MFEATLRQEPGFERLTRLTSGEHATVYQLTRSRKAPLLVKRYHKAKYFYRAASALGLLSRYSAPVPALVETREIDGEGVVFQIWWEGASLEPLFGTLPRADQLRLLGQAGAVLARVQQAIPHGELLQATFWHRNEFAGREEAPWRSYIGTTAQKSIERIQSSAMGSDAGLLADLECVSALLPSIATPETITLLHADFVLRNIFMRAGSVSVAGLLDFDVALIGDPLYDLAKLTWADLEVDDAEGRTRILDSWQAESGWTVNSERFALYESIQAITSLGWMAKQPVETLALRTFRQRAYTALARNRAALS